MKFDWNAIMNTVFNWLTTAGIRLIVALIVLFVSFKVVNFIAKKMTKRCEARNVDKTIAKTLIYTFKLATKICIAICLVGYVGIDTSGLAALVTSLGVCVGLAVNGALANLAGGIMIILTRPFKIDDYIEACGVSGTVEDIRITQTKLNTPDNKTIYIPNGTLSSSQIINYSEKDMRRVDNTFSISYTNDFEKAKKIILDICEAHELVVSEPAPFVRVSAHGSSSIDIVTRVWVKSSDYWTVHFDLLESVKEAFDKNGIEIPYEQVDVHVKNS